MNHPTREEWMSYLYDEAGEAEVAALATHLRACPECHAKVKTWQSARRNLDAWTLPNTNTKTQARRRIAPVPLLRWAAAAALVLGIGLAAGFGAGRFTAPAANVDELRAAVEPALREQLRVEFSTLLRQELAKTSSDTLAASRAHAQALISDYADALEARYTEDAQAIAGAFQNLEARRLADYALLKRDLDTVAVLTDAGLRETRQDLFQLADYAQPAAPNQPAP